MHTDVCIAEPLLIGLLISCLPTLWYIFFLPVFSYINTFAYPIDSLDPNTLIRYRLDLGVDPGLSQSQGHRCRHDLLSLCMPVASQMCSVIAGRLCPSSCSFPCFAFPSCKEGRALSSWWVLGFGLHKVGGVFPIVYGGMMSDKH